MPRGPKTPINFHNIPPNFIIEGPKIGGKLRNLVKEVQRIP